MTGTVLDTAMMAAMRAAINELLPDTCNTCSITHAADGQGGWTDTRSTIGTSLACRLDVVQGREQLTGGAIQPYTSYMLSLPYDAVVLPSYVVEVNNTDFVVKSVNRDQSWNAVVRVELERK